MGDNFFKILFTLLGIGAAVSFAKSLKSKSTISEMISDMIITSIFNLGAATILIFFPSAPIIAVVGLGALGSVLGVAFVSDKIKDAIDSKLGTKKDVP